MSEGERSSCRLDQRLTNGVEETVDGEIPGLARLSIAKSDGGEEIAVSLGLNRLRVPEDGDLGVSEETLGHDLGGAENVATNDNVDVGSVLQAIEVSVYRGSCSTSRNLPWSSTCPPRKPNLLHR